MTIRLPLRTHNGEVRAALFDAAQTMHETSPSELGWVAMLGTGIEAMVADKIETAGTVDSIIAHAGACGEAGTASGRVSKKRVLS